MLRSELELELLLFACGPFRSSSRPLFVLVRVALHYMAASKPTCSVGARVKALRKRFYFDWLEVEMSKLGFGLLRPTQVINFYKYTDTLI